MGGMSPQELAVPSCTANITVRSRSQAGRLTQPLCSQPPPAQTLCAQPHTNSPFLTGTRGQLLPMADDELKQGQGDAHCAWWQGEKDSGLTKPFLM